MEFVVSIIAIALMLIGAFGVILLKKPLDKVIMFSIMECLLHCLILYVL